MVAGLDHLVEEVAACTLPSTIRCLVAVEVRAGEAIRRPQMERGMTQSILATREVDLVDSLALDIEGRLVVEVAGHRIRSEDLGAVISSERKGECAMRKVMGTIRV